MTNFAVTGGLFLIVFIALVAATAPDIPVLPLLAVLVPIAFYPFSKTLWMAVDHAFLQRLGNAPPAGGVGGNLTGFGRLAQSG